MPTRVVLTHANMAPFALTSRVTFSATVKMAGQAKTAHYHVTSALPSLVKVGSVPLNLLTLLL